MDLGHMQGYLLKRNKEHRKTNLLGVKYKRRWVELTTSTLVYARSQQELLSGKIQVFAVQDLIWVRAEAEAKLLVKFKDRTLTFKVENGGSAERDQWVAMLEACKKQASGTQGQEHSASGGLGQLFKVAEQQLLGLQSTTPQSTPNGLQACNSDLDATPAAAGSPNALTGKHREPGQATVPYTPPKQLERANIVRQHSPRSLLASAKLGSAFVINTFDAGESSNSQSLPTSNVLGCSLTARQQQSTPFSKIQDNTMSGTRIHGIERVAYEGDDDDNDDDDDMADKTQHHVRMGSNSPHGVTPEPAVTHTEVDLQQGQQCTINCIGLKTHAKTTDRNSLERGSSSSLEQSASTEQQIRDRRATLTRRLTPGVMLINIGEPTNTSASAAASSASSKAITGRPTSGTGSFALHGVQTPGKQRSKHGTCADKTQTDMTENHPRSDSAECQHDSDSDDDLSGGILRLDPSEVLGCSKQSLAQDCKHTQGRMGHGNVTATVSTSCRPGSAPYSTARPGTPLKSCLRNVGSNVGSRSTPPRSSAMVTSAEAALHGTVSREPAISSQQTPSKLSTSAHCNQSKEQQRESCHSSNWLQDDWDSSDHEAPSASHGTSVRGVALGDSRDGSSHSQMRPQLVQHRSRADQSSHGPPVVASSIGVRGAQLGVRADKSWLDDDFDS